MAGRNKKALPKKRSTDLAQLGLMGLPGMQSFDEDGEMSDDGEDDSLEAELQAIMSGQAAPRKPKPKKQVDMMTIQQMANQCMKDSASEDDDDANISADEELMDELNQIIPDDSSPTKREASMPPAPPMKVRSLESRNAAVIAPSNSSLLSTLEERLKMYSEAEKTSKDIGDVNKARRFGRAVKTLETLMKEVQSGRDINEENIPPPVAIPKTPSKSIEPAPILSPERVPSAPANISPPPPVTPPRQSSLVAQDSTESISPLSRRTPSQKRIENTHQLLCTRRDQYKMAALTAKKNGEMENAIKFVKISKQFDAVIEAQEKGQAIDLSKMPQAPPGFANKTVPSIIPSRDAPAIPSRSVTTPIAEETPELTPAAPTMDNVPDEPEDPNIFGAPPPPTTVLEALNQRLDKYKKTQSAAVTENNTSKAKRLGRIVKQYEDAIKCHKAGKPVDFDSLPAPPGFGAIPGVGAAASTPGVAPNSVPPAARPKPAATPSQAPKSATKTALTTPQADSSKPGAGRSPNTLLDKQLNFLVERKRLFREAALESKNNGDIQQAKEYLRLAKGFDPMIEATQCGLPIDASTIPTPPQLAEDFVVVDKSQCVDDWTGDREELFRNLERDLTKQIDICQRNANHFLKLGDVSSSSKFEKLGQDTKRDLLVVQHVWQNGDTIPKFHYETRVFSMVQCNSQLGDNEVEVTIIRGVNLPGKPTDLDSYVRVEFPYPPETPQKSKTHTIKDTNTPEYNATFKYEMNRKSRSLARVFKRHGLKMEVWSKGGFLRSDSLIGTAQMKLDVLEKKCVVHDSYDLMDGRKACGGKVEAKLLIRDPLLVKQVEEVRERWLVIGS